MKTIVLLLPFFIGGLFIEWPVNQDQQHIGADRKPVRIEVRVNKGTFKDSGDVVITEIDYLIKRNINTMVLKPKNGSMIISEMVNGRSYLNFYSLLRAKGKKGSYVIEPGDQVLITEEGDRFLFSGPSAGKYRLQYELDSIKASYPGPNNKTGTANFFVDSVQEYISYAKYYKEIFDHQWPLLQQSKGKISDSLFNMLTQDLVEDALDDVSSKFHSMFQYGFGRRPISTDTLVNVYDTFHVQMINQLFQYAPNKGFASLITRHLQLARAFSFDKERIPSEVERAQMTLDDAMRVYKGRERDLMLARSLPKAMLKIGITPRMEKILEEYYASGIEPELKQMIREKEVVSRRSRLGWDTPQFSFVDTKGEMITQSNTKGKLTVLFFEGPEAANNHQTPVVQKAIDRYSNHPFVSFINISSDKDVAGWQKRSRARNANIHNVTSVHTGDAAATQAIMKHFAVPRYPFVWVLDSTGGAINTHPLTDLARDNGDSLVEFIQDRLDFYEARRQKAIVIKKDGPYVLYNADNAVAYSLDSTKLITLAIPKDKSKKLTVQTDLENTTFTVALQPSHSIQPTEYPAVRKLLALSDIEGNFDAFRKLLYANKVIDNDFNWVFGDGHVVFAGDMFDRGEQVTECLWLLYSLEEKAKKAGGYVHFVLGNHEIMNMQGSHHYAVKKYNNNAAVIGKTLTELYNENSELGRWLRTKNVIEKVGELLFVHGGISPEINRLQVTLEDINRIVRPYYGNKKLDSTDKVLMTLYNSSDYGMSYRISPFWTRGYYKQRSTIGVGFISDAVLDSSLSKFGARRVITGHTIVADTISVHYGNRVINTDTHHASRKSEALLVEGDHYYRVDMKGRRKLLFIDNRKRAF